MGPTTSVERHRRLMLVRMVTDVPALLGSALGGPQFPLVVCLTLACTVIVVIIPICASRGKLHVPGYVGLAFLAFAVGLLLGRIAGSRAVAGTIAGVLLSIVFFLLIATALGSVLALFFYRHPPEA
jgi:hypothetical protein